MHRNPARFIPPLGIGCAAIVLAAYWVNHATNAARHTITCRNELLLAHKRLEITHQIDRAILAHSSPEEIAQTALVHIHALLPFQRASIVTFDHAADEARVIAVQGHTQIEPRVGTTYTLDDYDLAPELRRGQVRLVRNVSTLAADEAPGTVLQAMQLRSFASIPLQVDRQLIGVLNMAAIPDAELTPAHVGIAVEIADSIAIAIYQARLIAHLQQMNEELSHAYDSTLAGWARALELRDKEIEGHSQRVTLLSVALAEFMGMAEAEVVQLRRGALLHDIGKIGIPDRILHKPGQLDADEWAVMRQHPEYACQFLQAIPYLKPALAIPCAHHEKWDGSGYPRGLRGEAIPLAARIFAVVDVFDALCSDRPYRKAWPFARVLHHIQEQSGSHFDPVVVSAFGELCATRPDQVFGLYGPEACQPA